MLRLYNSLTRKKEAFTPIDPNHVRMYVCGPTVYDFAHLGNARPVVVFDVLNRLLRHLYPKVTFVSNITDIDDKINAAASQNRESIQSLTQRTLKAYLEDMNELGIILPDYQPKATEHIPQMIALIERLISQDFAYVAEGHVLFSVKNDPNYGKLSNHDLDEMIAGARVEVAPYKADPRDFVLWKPSPENSPGWESPWGFGRPGWHIECSAMSHNYLGETFDIHGGGIDLIFPHHENEIAQSCCAFNTQRMANYWLHNGHLTVSGSKMSKSLGNFHTVRDILKNHKGETIRLTLLMTHYRQPLDWTPKTLAQSERLLTRFYQSIRVYNKFMDDVPYDEDILSALEDDINTPAVLKRLSEMVDTLNKTTEFTEHFEKASILVKNASLIGLLQSSPQNWFQEASDDSELSPEKIEILIQEREQARQNKDFQKADHVRQYLLSQNIVLEDTKTKTTWRRQS